MNKKTLWGLVGAGAVVLTVVGVYFAVRATQRGSRSRRVEMVEAIIQEAEELMRHQRSMARKTH